MNQHQQSWQRLVAATRKHHDESDASAPYGFAARVVTQARTAPALNPWNLMERFAVRGLIAACTFGIAAVAFGYTSWTGERDDEVATTDSVSEILDQFS